MSSSPLKPKRGKKSGFKHSQKPTIKPGSEIFYKLTHSIITIRPVCTVKPTPKVIPVVIEPVPIVREIIDIYIEEVLVLKQVAYTQENQDRPGPSHERMKQLHDTDTTVDYDSAIIILD